MRIKSSTKEYEVYMHTDFNSIEELECDENTFVIVDKKVYSLYYDAVFSRFNNNCYIVEAIEESKTIETALEICERMTELPAKRNAKLISFGGGIIQDITGFVASVLYRGIHWIFYPTTLLAACDSCIGGKTSLNHRSFKNLLGTFYAPDEIHICAPFFASLERKDFFSGLGEVFKFNFMAGEEGIQFIEEMLPSIMNRDEKIINEIVLRSLRFKKRFIEIDEFDRGERIKLNYAHTFGHAFETMSNYEIPHGTAVAMGLVVANRISVNRGWLDDSLEQRMENLVWNIIKVDKNNQNYNFSTIMSCIRKDKKQIGDSITCVLMKNDSSLEIVHDATEQEIQSALEYLFITKRDMWKD